MRAITVVRGIAISIIALGVITIFLRIKKGGKLWLR